MALSLNMDITLTPELRQLGARLGIGAALLVAAVYLLAAMPLLEGRRLDQEIAAQKATIERQQKLLPALASLGLNADNATLDALLPPKSEPVPRAQAYLITEQLGHMAAAVGLEALDVSLDPASMAADPNTIQVQGVFNGELEALRSFLLDLNQLPSLAQLDKVEIRAVDGRLEMLVQLRISLGG
jgi:type II secretory pathway component PulM